MPLTVPSLTDTSTLETTTATAAILPSRVSESPSSGLNGPQRLCLSRRCFAYQIGSAGLAIVVLLAGVAIAQGIQADSGTASLLDSLHPAAPAFVPVAAALVISISLVLLGSLATRRSLKPIALIEQQLNRFALSPLLSPENIEPLEGATALVAGWNRLAHTGRSTDGGRGVNERLGTAINEYRQRRGEHILNALTDGIAVTDEEQRVTSANNALYSILHLDRETQELLGESIEKSLARRAGKDPSESVLDSRRLGHRVVTELTCADTESTCVLRVCRTPLSMGSSSARGGFVWSVRDVTQQKMADKMRDEFVNAATHELRTPMANIKAYAEMLALGEVDDVEQQKMFCNVINDEVTRLARFIDDLLHLSRMEVGATTLQLQVTEIGRLLEETAKKLRPQMSLKNIDFTVELPGKLPELIVDKDKLAVAVINLLGNAAKYTPEGGTVRLHVELLEDAIQIDVEDTGIGIAEEELPKVLEKFYRSSDPRVGGEIGSGLGLSLAVEIIRLHGGKLSVTSELNKGSKFTILLPTTAE